MTDYKSMYFRLFNRVTDAIKILQEAQQESENVYIENENTAIALTANDSDEIIIDRE